MFLYFPFSLLGKSRLLWTDLALTVILLGGLLTILVTGSVDSGGMSAVIQKARGQHHFYQDSFSFNPTDQVSLKSSERGTQN